MMLVNGKCNEKVKWDDASETYIYFQNLYVNKPNNFVLLCEKDGGEQLSDEYTNHVRKWFVKQVKLGQHDSYWKKTWSIKFKFLIFCGCLMYLFICYIAYSLHDIKTPVK